VFSAVDRRFLHATAGLGYSNPFLPERIEWERAALGREYLESEPVWSVSVADPDADLPNILRIHEKQVELIEGLYRRLAAASSLAADELADYEDSVHSLLYQRYYRNFVEANGRWGFYRDFLADWNRYLVVPGKRFETVLRPAHVFACFYQLQRAFHYIFYNIIGSSMPAARLRASIWQSVFTHDMRRYRRTLYARMGDFPTLITGPSGTGKELVARAIAGSRYVPFDADRLEFAGQRAGGPAADTFYPVNVAALSPALIESELFGHRRGSFTGALGDRKGWLETCPPLGTVFLDELGEMELLLQVKLLRAIETRRFSAVGDTALREFRGKLIAATNRDLRDEIRLKHFREDLYYRLCADLIRTPSLREQIEASPGVLRELTLFMVRRVAGEEADRCLEEVERWMKEHLPLDYSWPGNYRELEQCVRNVIIRGSYQPVAASENGDDFYTQFRGGKLKMDEVLGYYASLVYRQCGSYEEAARRLGVDRRTVKARVDNNWSPTVRNPPGPARNAP
ncbi:MAG TPA: sigma 54-interacting transcriptional regulator, partial [Bryobacteraceae bacterium]